MAQFEGYLRRALRREREGRRMQVLIAASAFDDELRRTLLQTLSTPTDRPRARHGYPSH